MRPSYIEFTFTGPPFRDAQGVVITNFDYLFHGGNVEVCNRLGIGIIVLCSEDTAVSPWPFLATVIKEHKISGQGWKLTSTMFVYRFDIKRQVNIPALFKMLPEAGYFTDRIVILHSATKVRISVSASGKIKVSLKDQRGEVADQAFRELFPFVARCLF